MIKFKTTCDLNMRYGAGTEFDVICTIPKGKIVVSNCYCIPVKGWDWFLVIYDGRMGFCSSRYLKRVEDGK